MTTLQQKINNQSARIAIAGVGYVGLPLAVAFARRGFEVIGIDPAREKVDLLNRARTYITDISDEDLRPIVAEKKLSATADFSVLKNCDVLSICVPTPLGKTKDPDISYIVAVTNELKKYIHPGMLVILESTTYPGTTREVLLPALEERGYHVGKDFYLAFSPERIDPSNKHFGVKNTPKVIGGITPQCTEMACAFYRQVVETIVPVSSCEAAETVKLLENTFRSVNIGMVNEMAIMCNIMGLNTWEIIAAASTKPYGFMPFYPGPGLGGHCIPIDPYYLSWKLKSFNYNARFIEMAGDINSQMPRWVVTRVLDLLNQHGKCLKGARVMVLGMAYKKDVGDLRESPSLDIIKLLQEKGAKVCYHDPFIPSFREHNLEMTSLPLTAENLRQQDLVIIATDHSAVDYRQVAEQSRLVFDTRNATRSLGAMANVTRL